MTEMDRKWNQDFFSSLYSRAQSPKAVSPLDEIIAVEGHENLRLEFVDGSETLLKMEQVKSIPEAIILTLGKGKQIEPEGGCEKLTINSPSSQSSPNWRVNWDRYSLDIDTESGLTFSGPGGCLLRSIYNELSVGDVPQAFSLARFKNGFRLGFEMAFDEMFYGGGEDFTSIVRNGTSIELLNRDALGVGGGFRYQSTPVFYSSRGYILAQISAAPSKWDFGSSRRDVLDITTVSEHLSLLLLPCTSPKQGIQRYRQILKQCKAPPAWSHGLWLSRCYYQDQAEVEGVLNKAKENGIKVSVINLDARAWMRADTRTDFIWDESRFEDYKTFVPKLKAQGIRLCLWESPYVSSASTLYKEGVEKGFFALNPDGSVYELEWVPEGLVGFPTTPLAGLVDFTNPAACRWWQDLHRPYLKAGISAFKTDFGEEIPPEARFFDGSYGFEIRNRYADLYNMTVAAVIEDETGGDGLIWARSGHLEMASMPVKWGGDSQTTWRALRATLKAGLNQSVGGALFWSHDVGGFYGRAPEAELFLRWAQLALWGSHIRLHGTTPREPWAFDHETLIVFKEALAVREYLQDWILKVAQSSVAFGQSFITPLWYHYSKDRVTRTIDDQFMVGDQVVVAPFLEPNSKGRDVYLPDGQWLNLTNGQIENGKNYIWCENSRHIPAFFKIGSGDDQLFSKIPEILSGGGHG